MNPALRLFLPSIALMYYAAGLLVWVCSLVWSKDVYGWQPLAWYGGATLALVFAAALLWPLMLIALIWDRMTEFHDKKARHKRRIA
ncbi:MAG TPA: hypothetical protein VGE85_11435 [Terracidiphilus sp.]